MLILVLTAPLVCDTQKEKRDCHEGFTKKDCHAIIQFCLTVLGVFCALLLVILLHLFVGKIVDTIAKKQFIETFGKNVDIV